MKSIWISLFLFFFYSTAWAEEAALFSLDVPPTWEVNSERVGTRFLAPQNQCAIDVSMAPHLGVSLRELGISFYQALHGKAPKSVDGGMDFTVTSEYNVPSLARLTLQGEHMLLVVVSGECQPFEDIVQSLTIKGSASSWPRSYPLLPKAQESPPPAATTP